jgi:hypothetical protein
LVPLPWKLFSFVTHEFFGRFDRLDAFEILTRTFSCSLSNDLTSPAVVTALAVAYGIAGMLLNGRNGSQRPPQERLDISKTSAAWRLNSSSVK